MISHLVKLNFQNISKSIIKSVPPHNISFQMVHFHRTDSPTKVMVLDRDLDEPKNFHAKNLYNSYEDDLIDIYNEEMGFILYVGKTVNLCGNCKFVSPIFHPQ